MIDPGSNGYNETEVHQVLTALGKVLSSYAIYGLDHPVFTQLLESAYGQLCIFFSAYDALHIGVVGGRFVVNGQPVESPNSLVKGLERKVIALGITNLALRSGLTLSEFKKLIQLLNQADQDKLMQAIDSQEISNIVAEDALEYQLVRKGQETDNQSTGGQEKDPSVSASKSDVSGASEEAPAPVSCVNVDQIMAFIKGEPGSGGSSVEREVAKLASDPEKLGQMILESVVMRQSVQSLDNTESLADIVLGCLRKTFDGLKSIETFQKRSGKASMKKALFMLEESILDRIREVTGSADREQDKKIIEAIKHMKMDIDMESVIAKHAEQAAALQSSRKKMAAYVEKRGIADAKEVCGAAEIPSDEWQKITVESTRKKHGISPGTSGGIEGFSGSMNSLAIILNKLDKMMREGDPQDSRKSLIEQAEKGVSELTVSTEEKISKLGRKISEQEASENTVEGTANRMTVSQLLGAIAEITQELAQPLTAIDVVLEMILTGYAGEVSNEQRDLLKLATSSGDHLGYLMDQLKGIVGMPRKLGTDERFHHSLALHKNQEQEQGDPKAPNKPAVYGA